MKNAPYLCIVKAKDMKTYTIQQLNKIAKKDGLKLSRISDGYFVWDALNEERQNQIDEYDHLFRSLSVYVYRFTHLSEEQWLEELKSIKEKLEKGY